MARNYLLEKRWEFETNEGWLADAFLQVLEQFHIGPEDIYIPSFMDMSQIEFRTTKKIRWQIEYVFRRYINKDCARIDSTFVELKGGDWYAIY